MTFDLFFSFVLANGGIRYYYQLEKKLLDKIECMFYNGKQEHSFVSVRRNHK